MIDKSNVKLRDTVNLHGNEFIVINKYLIGEGDLKSERIDIIQLSRNHNDNVKALRIDNISPFSVRIVG